MSYALVYDPPHDGPPPGGGGGGDDGVGGGGGGEAPPPAEAIPRNLPTRESCYAAAAETWRIMRDEFCPKMRNQEVCLRRNRTFLQYQRKECELRYPAAM